MIRFNKNTKELYTLGVLNKDDYNTTFSNKLLNYIKIIEEQNRKKIFQQTKNFTDLQILYLQ